MGRPAIDAQLAIGRLLIKHLKSLSRRRETNVGKIAKKLDLFFHRSLSNGTKITQQLFSEIPPFTKENEILSCYDILVRLLSKTPFL